MKINSKLKKDILRILKDAKEGRVYTHAEVFGSKRANKVDEVWAAGASKREKTLTTKNALSHKEVWLKKRQKSQG